MQVPGVAMVREWLRRREVVYLVAPTGHPNYGDELIARAWLRHLAAVRPRATVVLDCHSPGQASLLLRGAHPDVVFVDTLWQLTGYAGGVAEAAAADGDVGRTSDIDAGDGPDPSCPWQWVAQAATEFGAAPRLAEGVDLFRRASSVHLLGGGYVNDVWPAHLSLVAAAARLAETTGARAYATGQGLIPVVAGLGGEALVEAASRFTVFDVRDEPSAGVLASVGSMRRTGDDAWLGVQEEISRSRASKAPARGGVTLCLQEDLTEDFVRGGRSGVEAMADFVAETLDAWAVQGDQVTVVEGIPGGDLTVPMRLGDRIAGSTTIPFIDVWRAGLPVGRGDTWISTRFHPHLVAAAAGDSGVAIIPRPDYYATKHHSLLDAGSLWTVADDPQVIPDRPDAGGFAQDDLAAAVARKTDLAHEIYPRDLLGLRR